MSEQQGAIAEPRLERSGQIRKGKGMQSRGRVNDGRGGGETG